MKSFNVEMEVAFPEISSAIETMSVLMDLMNSTVVSCSFEFFGLKFVRFFENLGNFDVQTVRSRALLNSV